MRQIKTIHQSRNKGFGWGINIEIQPSNRKYQTLYLTTGPQEAGDQILQIETLANR